MTDNEIIKALECCNKSDNGKGCFECPYRQYCPDCLRRRNEDTIDLINRYKEKLKIAKNQAIKEFANRLKCGVSITSGIITCENVDDLVKKMVGADYGNQ